MASPLHAREWTSADGKHTFDGEYISTIKDNAKLEFIHVSQDDDKKEAFGWTKSASLPWLTVLKNRAHSSGLGKFDTGTPSFALVDKNGKLLATGEKESMEKVRELSKK